MHPLTAADKLLSLSRRGQSGFLGQDQPGAALVQSLRQQPVAQPGLLAVGAVQGGGAGATGRRATLENPAAEAGPGLHALNALVHFPLQNLSDIQAGVVPAQDPPLALSGQDALDGGAGNAQTEFRAERQ